MKDNKPLFMQRQPGFMKTRQCTASRITAGTFALAIGLLVSFFSGAFAQTGDTGIAPDGTIIIDPIDPPLPCPTISVDDIREREITHQKIQLHFPWWLAVDTETLGDGDILVTGPNGYEQRGELISIDVNLDEIPLPLDPVLSENPDGTIFLPQPEPIFTATYQISAPGDSNGTVPTWTPEHNGTYAVSLLAETILTQEDTFLPPKLLGGFRVAIDDGEPETIQPIETRIHISNYPNGVDLVEPNAQGITIAPDPGTYWATVELFFDCPNVEVGFAELIRDGNTFLANVRALKLPLPDPEPVPILLAGENGIVEGDPDRPILVTIRTQIYQLGLLDPGEYRFLVEVNGEREGGKEFLVDDEPPGDINPPEAGLEVRNITQVSDGPQRMQVVYEDRSGIDLSSIGDGDIKVHAPCLYLEDGLEHPFPCSWEVQRARLIEIIASSNDLTRVVAVYEINPPEGGWTHEHNGFYPVIWCGEQICDRLGNCNREMRLGGFEVAIEPDTEPPIRAEAEIRVDSSDPDNVVAKVHIQFHEHAMVVGQDIFRDGNRIFLLAKAEPLAIPAMFPPPPPPSQDLEFEIGPLDEGLYVAIFEMNEYKYAVREFKVSEDTEPPIPAEVEVFVDASNPEKVIAEVKIQFRTPHAVTQGEVEREGHRIWLPAKAEPLPIITADLNAVNQPLSNGETGIIDPPLPEPIFLRYEIGELPPGGYLAIFLMNEFPYGAEDFRIDEPGPPIPAEVKLEVDTEDPDNVVAIVSIHFETPHLIVERDIHRMEGKFILEAIALPAPPIEGDPALGTVNQLFANPLVIEYPLGALEPGEYGALFVMNGFPYEDAGFFIPENPPFEAEVSLAVELADEGNWVGIAKIEFSDPSVRILDEGEPVFDGNSIKINATAAMSATADVPEQPFVIRYNLGDHLEPGPYLLTYCINDRREARTEFFVERDPPIPADVEMDVAVEDSAAVAVVQIQFKDHYLILGHKVNLEGNRFCIDLDVEGPLEILALVPPPATTLEISLGENLEGGIYHAILKMNGFPYADDEFRIHSDEFEVEVDLKVGVGDAIIAKAVVDFVNPYILVTNPGEPEIDGNLIKINATADEVVFITEPSGDPQTFEYNLGELEPGAYRLVYCINGIPQAHTGFLVGEDPGQPLPYIASIDIEQGDASWFATTRVILLPGQALTECGVVRQSENEFHVNITVDWVDYPHLEPVPLDPTVLPDGVIIGPDGVATIGGFPVRFEDCTYVLGVLEPGEYKFVVHSRDQTITGRRFEVPGMGPKADLQAENIIEPKDEAHRFSINYSDPDGLNHESIREAEVVVHGPDGIELRVELVEYASTENIPSTGASAVYAVQGPGGQWDHSDNGSYCVEVDREAVRDLLGNILTSGELDCFHVRIIDELPSPEDTKINLSFSLDEDGMWHAEVEIVPVPGVHLLVNDWGPVIHHGQTFVALATLQSIDTANAPIPEPLAHRYPLGKLPPGFYIFVFKTNLGHCAIESLTVPGLPGDPIDNWRIVAEVINTDDGSDEDGDNLSLLSEYFFALDPTSSDVPDIHPEIVEGIDGEQHLGLCLRRLLAADGVRQLLEVTRDFKLWVYAGENMTEVVEQTVNIDGTEELLICLREALSENGYRFIRIRIERD